MIAGSGNPSLNGDMSIRACENTARMVWQPSPSGTVWRKRMHLVGESEAGQVTSIVRYEPGASFPAHEHPGGEEILVLKGVFSDEHGDWAEVSYLPAGSSHPPRSAAGCLLYRKSGALGALKCGQRGLAAISSTRKCDALASRAGRGRLS